MSRGAYFNIPSSVLAFLSGVALRSFFNIPQNWVLAGLGLDIGFLAALYFLPVVSSQEIQSEGPGFFSAEKTLKTRASRAPYVLLTVFLGGLFFLGILRFSYFENNIVKDELHNHYGETLALNGMVVSADLKENSQRIVLATDLGRILVVKKIYPQYKYGDTLEIEGKIEEPENYGDFDVKKYLAKDQVYSQMVFPEISEMQASQKHSYATPVKKVLFSAKDKFEQNLKKILPEPASSLADGMLLGNQGVLDKNLTENFRKSGTIHILVLSGYNITVVGVFALALFGFLLPEAAAWTAAVCAILLFTLMSGGEAAAVRSAIMAIIGLLALRSGRKNTAVLALLWAAFLMVLWNPMLMRFDRGFQLSFLATLGLITASPSFKKLFKFLPDSLGLRENAASAFSAQIFVLPLLLSWGGEISWFSPLANILVVGAVPFIMFFSFLGGVFAFFSVFLGKIIASAAYMLISYQIHLVNFFGSLDFSIIQFGFFSSTLLAAVYAVLLYWAFRSYAKIY